jgi:hypothetical protein
VDRVTSRRPVTTFGIIALFVLLAGARVALAQGNGHAYGHSKNRPGAAAQPSAAGAPELQTTAGISTLSFGSWLDDASVVPRGNGTMSVAFSYWRTPLYHEVDVPVIDGGVGIAPRVQFNFSVPYYHASDSDGTVVRGIGDMYLSTKVQLKDPAAGDVKIGLALTPLVEILTYAPRPDTSRVSWAIPASVEFRRDRWRTFGSAGYFSRGALFASAAVEIAMTSRTTITGSISRSHSIRSDEVSAALGLGQSRTDVSGAVSAALNDTVSAFGAVARTISKQDANSSTLAVTGGIAFVFEAWRKGSSQ